MSQYQTGRIITEQGTPKVSGEGTAWLANVNIGDSFKVSGVNAIYTVALVSTDETLTLSSNYGGVSVSGESYQIVRDFTPNYDIPEIWLGDKDWPFHLTEGLRIIDEQLAVMTKFDVVAQGAVVTLDLAVSDLNKIHLLSNSGEATINLPSVDSDDIGSFIEFRKKSNGIINVIAADSDTLVAAGETQVTAPSGEATFDFIKLFLETATHWGCNGIYGPWETS